MTHNCNANIKVGNMFCLYFYIEMLLKSVLDDIECWLFLPHQRKYIIWSRDPVVLT